MFCICGNDGTNAIRKTAIMTEKAFDQMFAVCILCFFESVKLCWHTFSMPINGATSYRIYSHLTIETLSKQNIKSISFGKLEVISGNEYICCDCFFDFSSHIETQNNKIKQNHFYNITSIHMSKFVRRLAFFEHLKFNHFDRLDRKLKSSSQCSPKYARINVFSCHKLEMNA